MKKQALVIGLGQFGMSLVRSLSSRHIEVLAIDRNPELVQIASGFATEAMAFNAVEEETLSKISPKDRDFCVCAIGNDKENSIICTALLRQLGARHLVARATDPVHERILRLVGAHEVVNPEREMGSRMAKRLLYQGFLDSVPLGEDLSIVELKVPPEFAGKTLIELELPKRYGMTVAALRHEDASNRQQVTLPRSHQPLDPSDILIVVATEEALQSILEGRT